MDWGDTRRLWRMWMAMGTWIFAASCGGRGRTMPMAGRITRIIWRIWLNRNEEAGPERSRGGLCIIGGDGRGNWARFRRGPDHLHRCAAGAGDLHNDFRQRHCGGEARALVDEALE